MVWKMTKYHSNTQYTARQEYTAALAALHTYGDITRLKWRPIHGGINGTMTDGNTIAIPANI
ncbi:MAG: hypothetical protein ACLRR3_11985 [Eubacterium sp.]